MKTMRFFAHHKCATKWLGLVLEKISKELKVQYFYTHYSDRFPALDEGIQLYGNSHYDKIPFSMRSGIHIFRNPLDLLVSSYYSHLNSHSLEDWPELEIHRKLLKACDKKNGIYADWIFLERNDFYDGAFPPLYSIRSWKFDDSNFLNIRMESLVEKPVKTFSELLDVFGYQLSQNILESIVSEYSFKNLSKGREMGEEDPSSHYRKGVSGDWQNHLDLDQIRLMRLMYRDILERFYAETLCQKK